MELAMAGLLLLGAYWLSREGARLASGPAEETEPVVAVDPGHGGYALRSPGGKGRADL